VMHVAEIDHARDSSRLRPGRADENVAIVGVAVNHAAPEPRQDRNNIALIERQEFLDHLPPRGVADVLQVATNPRGARKIPFQFALCGVVREIGKRGVNFAEELAEAP